MSGNNEVTRKNPFAPRKTTTVRRGKDEVYPHRKGLNRPEFVGDSPLDRLFQELETNLGDTIESATLEGLGKRILLEDFDVIAPENLRYRVVDKLLQYLVLVQEYSLQAQAKATQKDLITISLHDIKTFGKLVNLIILFGIYPATAAFGIGVPIEKRRLNDFGKPLYKAMRVEKLPPAPNSHSLLEKYRPHCELLQLLYNKLWLIFATESDARSLLMKGSGYSDFLVVAITLATVPHFDESVRKRVVGEYEKITHVATTYELYQDYSLLISTPSPSFFKAFVMEKLQLIPACTPKRDGVLTLVEFVLGLRDNDEINVEKFEHVTSVLLLKPKSLSAVDYFTSIGNQCYEILVNINRPMIATCVGHFIEKLWLKNHRIVQDFFLKRIWENFNPRTADSDKIVLVSERDLNNNVNVILSLTNRGLPQDLMLAVFAPILVQFWAYYCFLRASEKPSEVAQNILVSFFTQISTDEASAASQLDVICANLVAENDWRFRWGPHQLVEIASSDSDNFGRVDPEKRVLLFMTQLDCNCQAFIALVEQLDDTLIKKVFVSLLSKWVAGQSRASMSLDENPFIKLVDLRLLENIGDKFKDRLAQTPVDILQLVQKVLGPKPAEAENPFTVKPEESAEEVDSDDEDESDSSSVSAEVITVVLELLSAIISETQPAELNDVCREILGDIQKSLANIYPAMKPAQSLATRIGLILTEEKAPDSELEAERRAFTRAITNLNDPLVPIRAHGLYLLRQLVEQKSPVVSVDFAVNLHLIQLRDADPFIYLNAIKGLDSLLALDDRQVLPVLVSMYRSMPETDTTSESSKEADAEASENGLEENTQDLDERLRVGEVLLRYIQAQNEAFSGDMARLVCEAALGLIRRPAKISEVPEGSESPAALVTTDNRLRMSAMSILGTCCNTNVLGIMDNIGNAIDCAVGILELETSKDLAIMRRSAIVLIHDLVCGTSKSDKVPFPRHHMEKVLTVLRYVEGNDPDLLVREQAASVLAYIDELVRIAMQVEQ